MSWILGLHYTLIIEWYNVPNLLKNKAAGIVTVIPRCCFKPEAELAKETGFSDSW